MKLLGYSCAITILLYTSNVSSFLSIQKFLSPRESPEVTPAFRKQEANMILPNAVLPPYREDESPSKNTDQVIISDVIGKERIINIFAGLTRDIEAISVRLESNEQNTTVLAPLNSEMQKLPRKPWEDPKDYEAMGEQAYDGASGEDRAQRNLRRFVEAHIVPASPWKEGEEITTLGGVKLRWEEKGGQKMIQPGNIEVSSIANKVANGEVWVLKGVVNYE